MGVSGTTLRIDKNVTFQGGTSSGTNNYQLAGSDLSIGGSLKITAAEGTDQIAVSTGNNFTVGGGVTLNGGEGQNAMGISGSTIRIGGNVQLTSLTQTGASNIGISGTILEVGGGIKISQGNDGSNSQISASLASIKGAVSVKTGNGADTVQINSSSFSAKGGIQVQTGAGNSNTSLNLGIGTNVGAIKIVSGDADDFVSVIGAGRIAAYSAALGKGTNSAAINGNGPSGLQIGSIKMLSQSTSAQNDGFSLSYAAVLGATQVNLGEGSSSVSVDSISAGGAFTVITGAGTDTVQIEISSGSESIFTKIVKIQLGAGTDSLTIGGGTAVRKAIFKGPFLADGGADSDTRSIDANGNVFDGPKNIINFEVGA
jgi:hypothetical protein